MISRLGLGIYRKAVKLAFFFFKVSHLKYKGGNHYWIHICLCEKQRMEKSEELFRNIDHKNLWINGMRLRVQLNLWVKHSSLDRFQMPRSVPKRWGLPTSHSGDRDSWQRKESAMVYLAATAGAVRKGSTESSLEPEMGPHTPT